MFYFGTNLKMHGTPEETRAFVRALEGGLELLPENVQCDVQCFVLPPFTSLQGLKPHAAKLWLGAQNMHWAAEGAYTGEISPVMLRALSLDLVMLGHAERRRAGETDEVVGKKVRSALRHGLRVLLCVGETGEQRRGGVGKEVLVRQLEAALQGMRDGDSSRLLIAYEPVWAIGDGGEEAEPEEVGANLRVVRRTLQTLFGPPRVPILYGGSVNEINCEVYASLPEVDGLFVGRAARQADGFLRVLERALGARRGARASGEPKAERSA